MEVEMPERSKPTILLCGAWADASGWTVSRPAATVAAVHAAVEPVEAVG